MSGKRRSDEATKRRREGTGGRRGEGTQDGWAVSFGHGGDDDIRSVSQCISSARLVRESLLAPPSAGIPSRVFGFRESCASHRKGFPHAWGRDGNLVPALSKMVMLSATIIGSPTSRGGRPPSRESKAKEE